MQSSSDFAYDVTAAKSPLVYICNFCVISLQAQVRQKLHWKVRQKSHQKSPVNVSSYMYMTCIFKTHSGSVWKVTWAHPEFGQVLASCSFDRTAAVWEEQGTY